MQKCAGLESATAQRIRGEGFSFMMHVREACLGRVEVTRTHEAASVGVRKCL